MSNLSQRIANLSPAKLELLVRRFTNDGRAIAEAQTIPRRRPGPAAPLSFAQQRLWFSDQLEPGNTAYNVPTPVRLDGPLNVAALKQSLNEVIRRHESLRTVFRDEGGRPVQIIMAGLTLTPPIADLRELPKSSRKSESRRLAAAEQQRSFDLAHGPLLRVTLLREGMGEHVALLTTHHIVSDGWSAGVLVRELAALYEAFSQGRPSTLADPHIQYVDFACWQREWLRGEALEEQLRYWRRELAGAPFSLNLPLDRPRPPAQTFHGARQSFVLPTEITPALQALCRAEGVTMFMALLAAFQVLLARYTGQRDFVVGTDVAGRNNVEIEGLIGFFINHVVLRSDQSDNPTFRALLARVRERTIGAYAHQDLPFEKLVEALQPERDPSRNPLFQTLFVLQNAPKPAAKFAGLTLRPLEVENHSTKFDLACFVEETDRGLLGIWNYSTDLFEAPTIARMAGHFEILLRGIVSDPDAKVSSYEIQTEAEKEERESGKRRRKQAKLKMFFEVAPAVVSLPQERLVETGPLTPGEPLPLVIRPAATDLDLSDWARSEREFIEERLREHGALLFRGFRIDSVSRFEQFAQVACPALFGEYGDLPRETVGGHVYGSTPYPPDKAILFHNEGSHTHQWPMKIFFCCIKAAQAGGETPLVDCRQVYRRLDPALRERFGRKQLLYVRNFTDGLDVSWQEFFGASDRAVVEEHCRRQAIGFEWKADNGLKLRQRALAVARHPATGELVFFNQIQLHHTSCLDAAVRQSLSSLFATEDFPRHVYYGDGSPIEDDAIAEIVEVYRSAAVKFPWREGDVLLLDNMLTAHGRNSFVGARKIVVAMGEVIRRQDVSSE